MGTDYKSLYREIKELTKEKIMINIAIGIGLIFFGVYMFRVAKETPVDALMRIKPQTYILGVTCVMIGLCFIYDGLTGK